jgi:5-formyltetrahydrofolate cyclo-ligase
MTVPSQPKDAVRAAVRERRRELVPGRDRAADASAIARLGLDAAYAAGVAPGDWVAVYESLPSEPPTGPLMQALEARGIRVMLPITLTDWELDWREAGDEEATPLGLDAIGRARVVFVPAQTVDLAGTRVGRGKGCYDRALPRTSARVIAVVHPWEVSDEPLPHDAHDRPVDGVLTADGLTPLERT